MILILQVEQNSYLIHFGYFKYLFHILICKITKIYIFKYYNEPFRTTKTANDGKTKYPR